AQISAAFVITTSGVMRAVPWRDLTGLSGLGTWAEFRFPDRWPKELPAVEPDVFWTPLYPDHYARRGRIATAIAPVYVEGKLAAEVGLDWAFEDLFTGVPDVRRPGEVELVFTTDGKLALTAFAGPQGRAWTAGVPSPGSPDAERLFRAATRGHAEAT